jgi:glycine dehydrogenase subunit 1
LATPYNPNDVEGTRRSLLEAIKARSVDDLYSDLPFEVQLMRDLDLPSAMSEVEVTRDVQQLLGKNITSRETLSFLGGGVWHHYVPAAVDSVANRAEFLTSYTPYQPEINQGLLQILFEYQSMLCELLDMEVVNSSMYDWASSLGEAARMAYRITGRRELLVPRFTHPERLAVLNAYVNPVGVKVVPVKQSASNGQIEVEDLKAKLSPDTAGLYVENPSYLGFLQRSVKDLVEIIHDAGGLVIAGVDPTSLGIVEPPGAYGADIVVGEGQPLGCYVNYGGPLLGIFACRGDMKMVRQVPGRLVGLTTTRRGNERGYCLVLQTREQHIRRERATSNICTNEALTAVRAAAYMALMGREGFRRLGEYVLAICHYAMRRLSEINGLQVPIFQAPHFKEFTVNYGGVTAEKVNQSLYRRGIIGGKPLFREFPTLGHAALFCVTELHTRRDVDALAMHLTKVLEA